MKHTHSSLVKEKLFVTLLSKNMTLLGFAAIVSSMFILAPVFTQQAEAATAARAVSSPFLYTFNSDGAIQETGSMAESSSPYFWLNSGGKVLIKNGIGSTILGALPSTDRWYTLYKKANALDTDGGKYPQNLLRLLTRAKWGNHAQEITFNINSVNMTDTPNRDGYSGILLMSRYLDAANLYYAGIRMDGYAVIKKKYKNTYYTLATKQVFTGTYNKTSNPNLIPEDQWLRLKSAVQTQPDGSVLITLSLDRGDGKYETILTSTDTKNLGGGTLTSDGYVGLRTDYMDVTFDNYRIAS